MKNIWSCKIGENVSDDFIPNDNAMREAVRNAYIQLTGKEPNFIFSGWGDKLSDRERCVVLTEDEKH